MTLKYAGDVCIQTQQYADQSVEQLLEERDQMEREVDIIAKSCKETVNIISLENKQIKQENKDLKEEIDRLELSYHEIIEQFSKMTNIQNEIL